MICRQFLLAGLLLWSASGINAQDRSQREKLADQLLGMQDNQVERADLERETLDAVARATFKRLRDDPGWNADDAVWQRNYPEFLSSFQSLAQPYGNSRAQQDLRAELVEKLTEDELRQIVAAVSGPDMAEMRALMKKIGLDLPSSIRMISVLTQPALYSRAEKDAMRGRIEALKEREGEIKASMPLLEDAMKTIKTPAFAKYQRIMTQMVRGAVARLERDPAAMKATQDFLAAWRTRVAPL